MKIIKHLIEDMNEEMEGAEHYAKKALEYKEDDRDLADLYAKLSTVEKGHADLIHEQIVRKIKAKNAEGVTTPAPMQAVYDWEHEKAIDGAARLKVLQDMYREA